jgi:hypothetical protein
LENSIIQNRREGGFKASVNRQRYINALSPHVISYLITTYNSAPQKVYFRVWKFHCGTPVGLKIFFSTLKVFMKKIRMTVSFVYDQLLDDFFNISQKKGKKP